MFNYMILIDSLVHVYFSVEVSLVQNTHNIMVRYMLASVFVLCALIFMGVMIRRLSLSKNA